MKHNFYPNTDPLDLNYCCIGLNPKNATHLHNNVCNQLPMQPSPDRLECSKTHFGPMPHVITAKCVEENTSYEPLWTNNAANINQHGGCETVRAKVLEGIKSTKEEMLAIVNNQVNLPLDRHGHKNLLWKSCINAAQADGHGRDVAK